MTFIKFALTNRSIPERTSCKKSTMHVQSCIVNMKSNTKFSDPQRKDRCLRKCSPTREFAPMQILAATVFFVLTYCCYYFFFACWTKYAIKNCIIFTILADFASRPGVVMKQRQKEDSKEEDASLLKIPTTVIFWLGYWEHISLFYLALS